MIGTEVYAATGNDTFTLFDRTFNHFADGDNIAITFPNDLVVLKTGKNGNTIYSKNETGNNVECVIRLIKGSGDDVFMQRKINEVSGDFPSFQLGFGEFVKRLGDGQANVRRDVYTMSGGVPAKFVDTKENVEGDIEQGVSIYKIMFAKVARSIQ